MIIGTVKFVARSGLFGMISRDDRLPKVYVSLQELQRAGGKALKKGQRFGFELFTPETEARPQAINLIFLEEGGK